MGLGTEQPARAEGAPKDPTASNEARADELALERIGTAGPGLPVANLVVLGFLSLVAWRGNASGAAVVAWSAVGVAQAIFSAGIRVAWTRDPDRASPSRWRNLMALSAATRGAVDTVWLWLLAPWDDPAAMTAVLIVFVTFWIGGAVLFASHGMVAAIYLLSAAMALASVLAHHREYPVLAIVAGPVLAGVVAFHLGMRRRARAQIRTLGELELKTAEQHAVFDTIADAVLTIEDDRVSSCNARFVDVVGRPRDVVIGSPLADLLPGLRAGVLDAGRPPIRIAHVRPDGRRVDLELRGRDLSRPHARQVWTCTDVTEQVRREREMQTLASRDDLTGLINRRALHHLLDLRFATQRPGGLLLVDLDGFKEINDVHGHATGDAVLSVIAQRMRDAAGDAVVGRLGGDEFVVVVEGSGPGEVEEAADAVRQACCQPIEVDEMVMAVAASIGLVRVTEDDDVSSSLRAADEAMYRAKQAGGDRWERSGPCRPRVSRATSSVPPNEANRVAGCSAGPA